VKSDAQWIFRIKRALIGTALGAAAALTVMVLSIPVICLASPESGALLSPWIDREGRTTLLPSFLTEPPDAWWALVNLYGPWLIASAAALAANVAVTTWFISTRSTPQRS
jgi:hypothetical protein